MSVYYTLVRKSHFCPMWKIELTITAKYRFLDAENPNVATYVSCKCPILENLSLPERKQNKEYGLFRFCRMESDCLRNIEFKPKIDIEKDGYSQ